MEKKKPLIMTFQEPTSLSHAEVLIKSAIESAKELQNKPDKSKSDAKQLSLVNARIHFLRQWILKEGKLPCQNCSIITVLYRKLKNCEDIENVMGWLHEQTFGKDLRIKAHQISDQEISELKRKVLAQRHKVVGL